MTKFQQEYLQIGYFISFSFILAVLLLGVVYLISFTSKVDIEKSAAYECGFNRFQRQIIF
jgi:NADH:ubiquinone oxidoreductase subunit 3 (subunit A)